MKSEITKGALYLFDDKYRERASERGLNDIMGTSLNHHKVITGSETTVTRTEFYVTKYEPFESGLAVLGKIIKNYPNVHGNGSDVCQLLFNNKSGVRYIYLDELKMAEKVSK